MWSHQRLGRGHDLEWLPRQSQPLMRCPDLPAQPAEIPSRHCHEKRRNASPGMSVRGGTNELAFVEELVSHAHAFAQQPTGILSQVKDQALNIAHFLQRLRHFVLSGLLKTGNVHIANAGTDQEMQVNAIAGNFIAHYVEVEWLVGTFPQYGDAYRRPFGTLQKIGDVSRAHIVGGFAVDRDNDVAWMNAGAIRGCTHEGRNDTDFVIARADRHAYAEIFAALFFAK